jgi:hypothetical protein
MGKNDSNIYIGFNQNNEVRLPNQPIGKADGSFAFHYDAKMFFMEISSITGF